MERFIDTLKISSLLALAFLTIGCESSLQSLQPENSQNIVGGRSSKNSDLASQYVAMLHDAFTNKLCTSVIIDDRVLLTAAHCVTKELRGLTVAFGADPLSGRYVLRSAKDVIFHDRHNAPIRNEQVDLALLLLDQNIPLGYKPVTLPNHFFPLMPQLNFTAIGYGRTHGRSNTDINNSGKLRQVNLEVMSVSADSLSFFVDQSHNKGICTGDSGGPALVKYNDQHYVIGIASATSWIIPSEVSDQNKNDYLNTVDLCSYKSIYVNLTTQSEWLKKSIKILKDKAR